MAKKSIKRQNIGNDSVSSGIAYQVFSTSYLVLRMFLYDDYKWVKQNGEGPIDDIQAQDTNDNIIYFQCKSDATIGKGEILGILTDFYKQYFKDIKNNLYKNRYVIFSLDNIPNLQKILSVIKGAEINDRQTKDEHVQSKLPQRVNQLYNSGFEELSKLRSQLLEEPLRSSKNYDPSKKISVESKALSKDEYLDFLGHIDIWHYPYRALKEDLYKPLETGEYPRYVYHILTATLLYDWVSKKVTKREVENLLLNLGVGDTKSIKPLSKRKVCIPAKTKFILFKVNEKFYKKLKYLLDLISVNNFPKTKKKLILEALTKDKTLAWHFLKNLSNLNKQEWFSKIKDNVIKSIVESEEDSAVKFQLLGYFEKCADKYSDEIVPLIARLERNTKDYNILSNLVKTLGKLKPKQGKNIKLLWGVFLRLTEHQHPWVRQEIPQAILSFVEYNIDKVLETLEGVFFHKPSPQDVTQTTPTLALTFQGADNENWVFEEAIKALSQLLNNHKYAEKALDLAIKVEVGAINADKKDIKVVHGIALDRSYNWLGERSFEDLKYNHDRKERVALEIEKALEVFSKSDKKLTSRLINKLLNEKFEVFYLIVIKTLIRNIVDFQSEAKSLIFNTNLWRVYNIRNYYLQNLVTKYFETTKGREIANFVSEISNYKERSKGRTLYAKQDLLISIPESYRTDEVKKELRRIVNELEIRGEFKITEPSVVTSYPGLKPDITIEELEKKNDDELVQIMIDSSMGKRAGPWDLRSVFAGLIDKDPERLKSLLPKMKSKKLEPDFAGEMIGAYINKKPDKILDITDFISQLSPKDSWAKIEIARYLNDICRKKEIQDYDQKTLDRIKNALFALSKDKCPETDETIKSNNPRPDDAVTRGINSVRGIATEALVSFSYYFPEDKEVVGKLKNLANDRTNAVKATLIYYLRYLIRKNYQLCEKIINKFRNYRDPEIDFALIHFFAQLDCDQFKDNKDFVIDLFEDDNEQIKEDLGELIGYKYVGCCDVQDLVDRIVYRRKGDKNTLRSLAFVFESQLGSLIGKENALKVASYLKELLAPQNEFAIVERASFVFERDEIKPEHFKFLDENGLIDELLKNKMNPPAHVHLVNYLSRCIDANISIDRCLEVLYKQVTTVEFLLSDHLIAQKISEIVIKLVDKELNQQSKKYLVEIFDKGLERGWDEFYTIYNNGKNLFLLEAI